MTTALAESYVAQVLAELGTSYVDLLLLHVRTTHDETLLAWRVLEAALRAGARRRRVTTRRSGMMDDEMIRFARHQRRTQRERRRGEAQRSSCRRSARAVSSRTPRSSIEEPMTHGARRVVIVVLVDGGELGKACEMGFLGTSLPCRCELAASSHWTAAACVGDRVPHDETPTGLLCR